MAVQRISSLLYQLTPRFQRLDGTHAAQRTFGLAEQLVEAVSGAEQEGCNADGSLEGRMIALAQALTAWAPQAAAALSAGLANPGMQPPWVVQFIGGCSCLTALAALARGLGVQPAAAFRIAAACQMVFHVGRISTAAMEARVRGQAAAGLPTHAPLLEGLDALIEGQLEAARSVVHLLQQDGCTSVAAAFARSTAKPAVLVPWLVQISHAMLALRGWLQHQQDTQGLRLIHDYTTFVGALTLNTYAEHAAAIAADAAAQEAIAGALLTCCLPHLAAKFGEAAAAGLPPSSHQHARKLCVLAQVLQCLPLASGLAQHMQAPGAAGTLRLAADVVAAVAALPRNLPASSDQDSMVADDTYLGMHLCAAGLLAACCSGLSQLPTATAGSSSNGHGGGVDCGGSGGGSSDGSVRGGGGSRSGGSGSGGSAEAGMSGELPMVAWELIAAVPHMCSAVRAVAPCTAAADLSSLGVHAKMFSLYSGCLPWLPAWLAYAPCSATQLAAWAAAAEAGLRLQPVLVQLDAALQQLPDGSPERQAVGRLAGQLMVAVCGPVPAMEASPSGGRAASEPATAAFGSQLLQAHLAGCRLAHRLSQQGAAGRAMETLGNTVGMAPLILTLLISLCQMLMRLFQQEPTGAELNAGLPPAVTQAACAAHVEAAGALAAMAAAASPAGCGSQDLEAGLAANAVSALASSLQLALQAVPSLAGPATLAPVEALLPMLLQGGETSQTIAAAMGWVAQQSVLDGRWAAALASSGLLAAGLDAAASLVSSGDASSLPLVGWTLDRVAAVLAALDAAAMAAVDGGASSGLPDALAAQLGTAAASLRAQRQAGLGALPADAPPAEHVAQLQPLLPLAADVAALLQQYCALPAVDKPQRLALAQAAAGRCCAYLRCANVEGPGGPAARQGAGSKCCSACHAVWYCGTACSHADWREEGHRRVCRALGAARQAAVEARRAARAAAEAAAEQQE